MGPNFSGLTYLLGELGNLAALLGMLGFALVAHQIWVGLSHGTQAEREAAFLEQFTGCHDYMASERPLLAGEAAPPSCPTCADEDYNPVSGFCLFCHVQEPLFQHGIGLDRRSDTPKAYVNALPGDLYPVHGYTPAATAPESRTFPSADRSLRVLP